MLKLYTDCFDELEEELIGYFKKKGIKEVAKNLKDTLSDEDIAERTGLSIEEIKKL